MVSRIDDNDHEYDEAVVTSVAPSLAADMSEDFGTATFRPSLIRVMQQNSPSVVDKEVEAGHFFSALYGDLGERIVVVPLQKGNSRILNNFNKKSFRDQEIVCSSSNAVEGRLSADTDFKELNRITGICNTCPFADWGPRDPKTGKPNPPKCTLSGSFTVYLPEEQMIGKIDFSRTALPTFDDMMSSIQLRGEWGVTAFSLSLRQVKGDYPYYKPVARTLRGEGVKKEWLEGATDALAMVRSAAGRAAIAAIGTAEDSE